MGGGRCRCVRREAYTFTFSGQQVPCEYVRSRPHPVNLNHEPPAAGNVAIQSTAHAERDHARAMVVSHNAHCGTHVPEEILAFETTGFCTERNYSANGRIFCRGADSQKGYLDQLYFLLSRNQGTALLT